jgi:NADH-quinone oxidoreductase subunit H
MMTLTIITDFLAEYMPADVASTVELVIVAAIYLGVFALLGLFLVWMERRVAGFFQLRLGPNRRGPMGLFQTVADALKLVSKELTGTERRDKFLYQIAPYFVIVTALTTLGIIPFSAELQAFDFNIGIFFVTSVSSVAVIGIFLAGWASNNKYSLIGGMRSGIQMISYELSTGMVIVTMAALTGTLQLSGIVNYQAEHGWLIWSGHIPAIIGFMIFTIAGTAESNRTPFDLVEAESELGAGYHSEYSGMNFAYYFLAEFVNMFIISAMAVVLFFGGWLSPFGITDGIPYMGAFWFVIKTLGMVFLMMWFRWTFPRFRIDQLLTLEWKYLIPISMVNIVLMALVVWLGLTL